MTTWVRVARVGKPFGVAGRVTVQVFTDDPAIRFVPGTHLAADDSGADQLEVSWVGRSSGRWLLGFAGVTDRDAALELRDRELYAAVADAPVTGRDEWFDWQLVGLPCRDPAGAPLGEVAAVEHYPAHDLLVVRTPDGAQVRVPFVSQIAISVAADGLVLDPPGGLFESEG